MQTMSEQKAKAQDWAGLILGAEDLSDQPPTLYLGLERGRDPAALWSALWTGRGRVPCFTSKDHLEKSATCGLGCGVMSDAEGQVLINFLLGW